jgi:DNA polymerase III subunit beta
MKLKILQENLIKALTRTGRNISSKTQLPILANVLLTTENGLLRITTTNMEITVSSLVGAKIEKEGSVCVSSKLLTELVMSMPQETITLEEKDGQLTVSTTRTHASLTELPVNEFPPVDLVAGESRLKLGRKAMLEALGATTYAAATDDGRPLLTGIKITSKAGGLVFAATDGYRLSVKTIDQEVDSVVDLVVPARAMIEVEKALTEEKEDKPLVFDKNSDGQLCLVVGETTVIARLIEGEYPPYEKIIPATHTTSATFDKEEFLQAIKSASIFARDNANIVRLHLDKSGITASANAPQVGQNTVSIEAEIDGDDADIAFNSRFLIDFLNNFNYERLVFEMTGSLNSGVFKPEKDASFLHIIMPVRVQS